MLRFYLALIDDETDRQRFTRLYNGHRDTMFRYALRILRDEMLAEDAVQEAFIRIALNIHRIDTGNGARGLLLTVVRNTALTIRKKQSREIVADIPWRYDGSGAASQPEQSAERHDTAMFISRVLDEMPDIYSEVFRLKYGHSLTYSQIAPLLGISASAAKKRAQRAREMIRERLEMREHE